ncbi:methyltransferase domain-containing protein [Naumannella sp. ID2617S]|nr:methyltransferase domain-containing protein [Naumannella sp. ID2617S]
MADWDPGLYLRYADDRGRPFFDLLARVGAEQPRRVVDLGCGPGNLTRTLGARWPGAELIGVDSSPAMITRARQDDGGPTDPSWVRADLRDWEPDEPVDAIISNAALQWIPDHQQLLPRLLEMLTPDGWLAYQVPVNFNEPSHRLLRELSADPRFASRLDGVATMRQQPTADAVELLAGWGCTVDAWETTYLHVLTGPDPVFSWISGTGARPTLEALPDSLRATFSAEYRKLLRQAYPSRPFGTVLPFPRAFVVAHRI